MAYSNAKCCSNCQYWDGPRKVSAFKNMAEVRSMADMGVCQNKKSTNTKGRPQRADHPCSNICFEKWNKLM